MSPFTYMYLRTKEIWHSYFDRMVEAAWNRAKERKEREERNKNISNKIDKLQSYTLNHMYNQPSSSIFNTVANHGLNTINLGTVGTMNSGAGMNNEQSTSLNFTVHTANGGKIVEYRTNNGQSKLYIIPEGADLGQEIGKIITLEILKA